MTLIQSLDGLDAEELGVLVKIPKDEILNKTAFS